MTPQDLRNTRQIESSLARLARAEKIKETWHSGQRPDAAAVLSADAELAADRAVGLELAYEEYCRRTEAGETVDAQDFCARFSFATSLRRLLDVHKFLEDHPHVLESIPKVWPATGASVGDFIVQRELGRGGFSRVYLATESTTGGRPVAIKVTSAGALEARTLGPLSHPSLIPVLSSPTVGAWTLVAMPFLGTATLEQVIERAWRDPQTKRTAKTILDAANSVSQVDDPPFTSVTPSAIEPSMEYEEGIELIAADIFSGIAYLHSKGIAHRDLKPSNVLLGPTGHPYLLDFNLATSGGEHVRTAGTLPYMAPEQLQLVANPRASAPSSWEQTDIFSIGIVLFELLSGRHPFANPQTCPQDSNEVKIATLLLEAQHAGPQSLAQLNPRVGKTMRLVIESCLICDPNRRPSAAGILALLAPKGRSRKWRRVMALGMVSPLVLTLLTFWPGTSKHKEVSQQTEAKAEIDPIPISATDRGLLLFRKGEVDLAASIFKQEATEKQDGRLFGYAAYCYSLRKEHKVAEVLSNSAIRLGFETPAVYANRAYNRLRIAGRLNEAKSDCDRAIAANPDLRGARYTRALIHLQTAFQNADAPPPEEAIKDIEKVVSGSPNTADIYETAAFLYALSCEGNSMMRDKAAAFAREAIQAGRDPKNFSGSKFFSARMGGHPLYESALLLTPKPAQPSKDLFLVNPDPQVLVSDSPR